MTRQNLQEVAVIDNTTTKSVKTTVSSDAKFSNAKVMEEEKRNLLYVCVKIKAVSVESKKVQETKEELTKILQNLTDLYLQRFRTKPEKVYLVWLDCEYETGSIVNIPFTIRLKSAYDTDFIIPYLEKVKNVIAVETSWFPSRESYGGTMQEDGSVIETWDI